MSAILDIGGWSSTSILFCNSVSCVYSLGLSDSSFRWITVYFWLDMTNLTRSFYNMTTETGSVRNTGKLESLRSAVAQASRITSSYHSVCDNCVDISESTSRKQSPRAWPCTVFDQLHQWCCLHGTRRAIGCLLSETKTYSPFSNRLT